jgi:UDPglucose 6-dehydrogenase
MVGSGYVGLVSGACFSEFGTDVVCVDKDVAKIQDLNEGRIPIFEPGLDRLVAHNVEAGRLSFSTDLAAALQGAAAVFIAVGTPSRRGDGHADLSYVYEAAQAIAQAMDEQTVVVTKSTVPVGTGREVARIIAETRPDVEFDVVSNPEFLREGSAIEDFMRPNRIVIGPRSPSSTKSRISARRSEPMCMAWPAAWALTGASAASSFTRGRVTAGRAFPRTPWR